MGRARGLVRLGITEGARPPAAPMAGAGWLYCRPQSPERRPCQAPDGLGLDHISSQVRVVSLGFCRAGAPAKDSAGASWYGRQGGVPVSGIASDDPARQRGCQKRTGVPGFDAFHSSHQPRRRPAAALLHIVVPNICIRSDGTLRTSGMSQTFFDLKMAAGALYQGRAGLSYAEPGLRHYERRERNLPAGGFERRTGAALFQT